MTGKKKVILLLFFVLVVLVLYILSGFLTYKKKGMFREFYGIATILKPADLKLYRDQLPKSFSMPKIPEVAIFIVNYTDVAPWPLTPYFEGAISLKCNFRGVEGWFVKTMPVTTWVSMKGGRSMGFPKYIADKIIINKSEGDWKASVIHKDICRFSLEYDSNMTQKISPETEKSLKEFALLKEPAYLLVPPDKGPAVQRIKVVHAVDAALSSDIGMVSITINQDEPWAGLVKEGMIVPGVSFSFKGGLNMEAELFE